MGAQETHVHTYVAYAKVYAYIWIIDCVSSKQMHLCNDSLAAL